MAEHLQVRDSQIREKTAEIEEANRRLHDLNETLEEKVQERTHDLQSSLEQIRRTSVALEDSKRRLEITNRDLVRANQAKANFLSIISHEHKTPLSVINGFLSLILDERYENDAVHLREAVQISKRRGEQLSRMIDELIEYKKAHYPSDQRRIIVCGGTPEGTIHVEWLQPAAPGVDVKWETALYGMVRGGLEEEAVRFLQKTRKMSRTEARMQLAKKTCASSRSYIIKRS
jgi:hypothetical protein